MFILNYSVNLWCNTCVIPPFHVKKAEETRQSAAAGTLLYMRTFANEMKKIIIFLTLMLLFCGIGYTLEKDQLGFSASVPYGRGNIQMNFLIDKPFGWGCGTGRQEYDCPCVDADTDGELVIPDSTTMPDGQTVSVNWISRGSFQSCPKLTKIHIPNTVRYISDLSFAGCNSLREITIPDGIRGIFPQAFIGCTGLRRVRFLSSQPPGVHYIDAFDEITYATATLVVPAEATERYQHCPLTHRFRYHAEILPLYKETH